MSEAIKVNVLGSEWTIIKSNPSVHPRLEEYGGYCDSTINEIVIDRLTSDRADVTIADPEKSNKRAVRHELVHAFLYESGLADDAEWAANEAAVDWIARQFPKMLKAFQEVDAL